MTLRKKGLVAAMDSIGPSKLNNELLALEDLLATRMLGNEDKVAEIEDYVIAIEDASLDLESLNVIKDTMSTSLSNDETLSEPSLKIAKIAVESIYLRLGIGNSLETISVESLDSTSMRHRATELALESVKENIKSVWNAILTAIRKAIEKVISLFKGVKEDVTVLEKRNQLLLKKINGMTVLNSSLGTSEKNVLVRAFAIEGMDGIDSVKLVQNNAILLTNAIPNVLTRANSTIDKFRKKNDDMSNEEELSFLVEEIKGIFKELDTKLIIKTSKVDEPYIKGSVVELGPFVGGKLLYMTSGNKINPNKLVNGHPEPSIVVYVESDVQDMVNVTSISLGSEAELKAILNKNTVLIKSFHKLQDFKKTSENLIKNIEDITKIVGREDYRKDDKVLSDLILNLSKFVLKLTAETVKISFTTIKNVDTYITDSIGNLTQIPKKDK